MSHARRNINLALAMLCSMLGGCGVVVIPGVLGSGMVDTQTRDVGNFTEIRLVGSGRIEITIGELQPIEVTTDDNLLPLVSTQVQGDTLTVRPTQSIVPTAGLTIRVTVPNLTSLRVDGSGSFDVGEIDNESFSINIIGSGNATLRGQTMSLFILVSGSGNISARDLVADEVEVRISGSGAATVHAVETLDVTIEGSGRVRYAGNPQVSQQVFGSGSVQSLE